jgi:hypothetical protein
MNITHKLTQNSLQITGDTNSITSDCQAICFDNYGEQAVVIYINDTQHEHQAATSYYLAPKSFITFGNNINFVVKDVFDVVFTGTGIKGLNVLKQFIDRIE